MREMMGHLKTQGGFMEKVAAEFHVEGCALREWGMSIQL